MVNVESKNAADKDGGDDKATKLASEDAISCPANVESGLRDFSADTSNNMVNPSSHESIFAQMVSAWSWHILDSLLMKFLASIDDFPSFFGFTTLAKN